MNEIALVICKNIARFFCCRKGVVMKVKIRLNIDSYVKNGKIINILERVREKEKYDFVEIECDDWKEIKQVSFKGQESIPMEIEDDEIIFWKIEGI